MSQDKLVGAIADVLRLRLDDTPVGTTAKAAYEESKHPRKAKGNPKAGQWEQKPDVPPTPMTPEQLTNAIHKEMDSWLESPLAKLDEARGALQKVAGEVDDPIFRLPNTVEGYATASGAAHAYLSFRALMAASKAPTLYGAFKEAQQSILDRVLDEAAVGTVNTGIYGEIERLKRRGYADIARQLKYVDSSFRFMPESKTLPHHPEWFK